MRKRKIIIIMLLIIILAILMLFLIKTQKIDKQNEIEEIAKVGYTTTIGTTEYSIDSLIETNIIPTISAGMIPIKYDGEEFKITTKEDADWYNYDTGKPAYMMLNDGIYQSEVISNMAGKKLASEYVGVSLDKPKDIGTIYMWIPRFAINDVEEIIYIKQGCSVVGTWSIPEVFKYEIKKEDKLDLSLAGIWVEYEPLENETIVTTKISKMAGEGNEYGLIANTLVMNANEESLYIETIEKFIGNSYINSIKEINNTNRTIVNIINTSKTEAIKANYKYDSEQNKRKIQVTANRNEIKQIEDINGNILSTNSKVALSDRTVTTFIITDSEGNRILITTKGFGEGNPKYEIAEANKVFLVLNGRKFWKTNSKLALVSTNTYYINGKYSVNPMLISNDIEAVRFSTSVGTPPESTIISFEFDGQTYYLSAEYGFQRFLYTIN